MMKNKTTFDIFVNYRRQDSRADAGRICDRLNAYFGENHVFMDVDDIDPGQNFVNILEKTLDSCTVLLVLIGPNWLDSRNEDGERRLDQANDFVRLEIQRAIERNITIIPVLVNGAKMPAGDELPPDIALLSQYQALEISDKRFHPNMDRLITEIEVINGRKKPSKTLDLLLRWSLLMLTVLVLAIIFYFGVDAYLTNKAIQDQVQIHIEAGAKFAKQQRFKAAIKEFDKARHISPDSIEPYRNSISTHREHLLQNAFLGNSSLDIGLVIDYDSFVPNPQRQIDEALDLILSVQALDPSLKEDPAILLDEALILKASGRQAKLAIMVLEKAKTLDPGNAAVLAEFGLLNAVLLLKTEGIGDIDLALEVRPDEARYHFYLASALDEIYRCHYFNQERSDADQGCTRAIRAYHRAADLTVGEDNWSKHIFRKAIKSSLDIFHRYNRKEQGILTPNLALSLEERIKELEFLIPRDKSYSRNGWQDYPRYWLTLLYNATNQPDKALVLINQLIKEKEQKPVLWQEVKAKLLENIEHDIE